MDRPTARISDRLQPAGEPLVGTLRDLVRVLGETGATGHLHELEAHGSRVLALEEGVPRYALDAQLRGLPALVSLARSPGAAWRYTPGRSWGNLGARIDGEAHAILLAMFGPNDELRLEADDLHRAEDVQRHLVGHLPQLPGYDLGSFNRGLAGVSGDFHDVGQLKDGRTLLVAGDAVGHGVQAALVVAFLLKTIRLLRGRHFDLRQLLIDLNEEARRDLQSGRFVTLAAAALSPNSGRCELALLGHPQGYHLHAGAVASVGSYSRPLGISSPKDFDQHLRINEFVIAADDCLVLASDGLLEAEDDLGTSFDDELPKVLLALAGQPAQAVAGCLAGRAIAHASILRDDVSALVLRRGADDRQRRHSSAMRRHPVRSTSAITVEVVRRRNVARRVAARRDGDTVTPLPSPPADDLDLPDLDPALLPRRQLGLGGDYEPGEELGRGGLSQVVAARQRALGRTVAIKRLLPQHAEVPRQVRKFLYEARLLAALDHPGILPVHELACDQDGAPFLAMPRIEASSWLERIGRLDELANLQVLMRVCDALAYAHAAGVIHRDLKPDNILLGDYGEVLVADWGMAAYIGGGDGPFAWLPRPQDGLAVGSPAYMSPEMALADTRAIGVASDIYLLGAILFEIVGGQPPHDAETVEECLHAAAANAISGLDTHHPLLAIAGRCLATDPEQRPPSALALRELLAGYLRHREGLALAEQGRQLLRTAEGELHGLHRALGMLEQAAQLCPADSGVHQRLLEARRNYGEQALERGDLDLARQMLSELPEGDPLLLRLDQGLRRREQQRAAERRLDELQTRLERDRSRSWHILREGPFSTDELRRDWRILGGSAELGDDGSLLIAGGKPQLLLWQRPLPGDLRIEFTVTPQSDPPNDVTIFFAGSATSDQPHLLLQSGYQVKIGAYDNALLLLIRCGRRLFTRPLTSLVTGRPMQVRIDRVDGLIALQLDGAILFAEPDPQPLQGHTHSLVGISGWTECNRFNDLRISVLGAPLLADLLETARSYLAEGRLATAADLFKRLASGASSPATRASARQGLDAVRSARLLRRRLLRGRRRLRSAWPKADISIGDYGLLAVLPPDSCSDLTPATGLPLRALLSDGNTFSDLKPLHGAPLERLACNNACVHDLSPLSGLPLSWLSLSGNPVSDLAPLHGLPLTNLNLSHTAVSALAALHGARLVSLLAAGLPALDELAPLAGMPLSLLNVSGSTVRRLDALAGSALLTLDLTRTLVKDLTPLTGLPLIRLRLERCPVSDLSPVQGSPIRELHLAHSAISDLRPLINLPLRELDLRGTPAQASLAILSGRPLRRLFLDAAWHDQARQLFPEAEIH